MDLTLAKSLPEFESSIGRLLADAAGQNRRNVLGVRDLRQSLAETHRQVEADERADGAATAGTYWELVMADWSAEEPALFVIAAWRSDALSVCAGAGQKSTIVGVCDRYTMAEVDDLVSTIEAEVGVSAHEVRLPRGLAEYWVAD